METDNIKLVARGEDPKSQTEQTLYAPIGDENAVCMLLYYDVRVEVAWYWLSATCAVLWALLAAWRAAV